jgi:hypothetical protein
MTKLKRIPFLVLIVCMVPLFGYAKQDAEYQETIPARAKEALSIYEVAELITGTSAEILRGIAKTESDERDDAIGDDGISIGRFQWNKKYLPYFWSKYGYFDPHDGLMSAIRAGQLFQDNLKILGSQDLAISAHKQGPTGVKKHGPCKWYVEKVRSGR